MHLFLSIINLLRSINKEKKAKMEFQHDFLDNLANDQYQKLLREVTNDDKIPKKSNKVDKTLIDISKDTTILDVNLYD